MITAILLTAAFAAILGALYVAALHIKARSETYFVNDGNIQIHTNGVITRTVDAALARYRLVKPGATPGTSVAVAGAADTPIGVTLDDAVTTSDQVSVQLLAGGFGTTRMTSDGSAAIAIGDQLVPAANGMVKTIAVGAGNYVVVGIALSAVAISATGDDALLEVAPVQGFRTK